MSSFSYISQIIGWRPPPPLRLVPWTSLLFVNHVRIPASYLQWKNACRKIDWLSTKRLAGAAPEMNRRNPGGKTHNRGIHPAFETQGSGHQNSKTGISGPNKRTCVLQKKISIKKKKNGPQTSLQKSKTGSKRRKLSKRIFLIVYHAHFYVQRYLFIPRIIHT